MQRFFGVSLLLTAFLLMSAPAPALGSKLASRSEPDRATERSELLLLWYDAEDLLPSGFEAMAKAFERLFRPIGAQVTIERASGVENADQGDAVRVIAVSRVPASWGLGLDVLAVAPNPSVRQKSVYVILPRVRHELRHLAETAPNVDLLRQRTEMTRALSRLIAHEVVHAVAPAHPHAASGLMRARQPRSFLLRQKMKMDPACVAAFEVGLASRALALRSGP